MVSSQCPCDVFQCLTLLSFVIPVSNQNSWIPVSGHWDDTIIKEPVSATWMTPFFLLDSSVKHWNDTIGALPS
ncbi:hypothetical protein [Wolbachia endosymbiont (group A) of Anomoia purmunda]|uniref:hypothetical protein n=1 Tax=Wolbachia endosymbiont (group A) of Anomoia purmunda TaxID=2953978 RepID=UPI00222F75C3|nr:hypothetical protein [Wolbachia endosymbiont (group A) of Anomoia purmunda]